MLDQAFDALNSYDWGADPAVLNPIGEAVIATRSDDASRQQLEARLAAVLTTDVSRDAKDYVCRQLMLIGTASSVPVLAALLPEQDHSHMARYALERIEAPEAAQALRDALPKLDGALQVGVIGSLGVRRDEACVGELAKLLSGKHEAAAQAAAYALGDIRTAAAAEALAAASPQQAPLQRAVSDARLACAEGLLADGNKAAALAIYKSLTADDQPQHVRLAGTRGVLACAAKK